MHRSAAVFALVLAACASGASTRPPEVERTERALDLSGEWNDVDADLVAREMIEDCFKTPWVDEWRTLNGGKKPQLRLYPIKNKTAGYIDYRFFTKQLEQALVRSGRLDVLSGTDEAEAMTAESGDASEGGEETPKGPRADFVLNGWILSQDDRADNREVRSYLTSIEILETSTGKKAWVGQKRIRKLITR